MSLYFVITLFRLSFLEAENGLKVPIISSRQLKAAKTSSCLRVDGNTVQYFFLLHNQTKRRQVPEFEEYIHIIILYVQ